LVSIIKAYVIYLNITADGLRFLVGELHRGIILFLILMLFLKLARMRRRDDLRD
jgi:hypothetical protein